MPAWSRGPWGPHAARGVLTEAGIKGMRRLQLNLRANCVDHGKLQTFGLTSPIAQPLHPAS